MPDQLNGVPQIPLHGASIAPTFADAAAPAPRSVQYFEQMGHRGIWADGWKATTYHEPGHPYRSEEHTSELQSLMRISYAVFCLKKKKTQKTKTTTLNERIHRAQPITYTNQY